MGVHLFFSPQIEGKHPQKVSKMPRAMNTKNIKKVLDAIKDYKKTYTEILNETGISSSSLDRYLPLLLNIGVIKKIENKYVYSEYYRKLSPKDYDLAFKHSKKLFDTEVFNNKKLIDLHPYIILDYIIFQQTKNNSLIPLSSIYSHLLNGYSSELRDAIIGYKRLIEEIGLQNLSQPPYLSDCLHLPNQSEIPIESVVGVEYLGENASEDLVQTENDYWIPSEEERNKITPHKLPMRSENTNQKETFKLPEKIQKTTINKLLSLRRTIVNDLIAIIFRLEHGVPLDGVCKYCPKQYLKIEE